MAKRAPADDGSVLANSRASIGSAIKNITIATMELRSQSQAATSCKGSPPTKPSVTTTASDSRTNDANTIESRDTLPLPLGSHCRFWTIPIRIDPLVHWRSSYSRKRLAASLLVSLAPTPTDSLPFPLSLADNRQCFVIGPQASRTARPCLPSSMASPPAHHRCRCHQFRSPVATRGYGRGTRQKLETDTVEILSGIWHGVTLEVLWLFRSSIATTNSRNSVNSKGLGPDTVI